MKRPFGFTLIELMVAIAIFAIIAGLAAPSFVEMLRRNRIAVASNELLVALQLARSEAIKHRRQVIVCARNEHGTACVNNANWAGGWLVGSAVDNNNALDVTDAVDVIRVWDPLGGALAVAGPGAGIVFEPDGRREAAADALISVSEAGVVRNVTVLPTGRARVDSSY